jgi:hypothetical protein
MCETVVVLLGTNKAKADEYNFRIQEVSEKIFRVSTGIVQKFYIEFH